MTSSKVGGLPPKHWPAEFRIVVTGEVVGLADDIAAARQKARRAARESGQKAYIESWVVVGHAEPVMVAGKMTAVYEDAS